METMEIILGLVVLVVVGLLWHANTKKKETKNNDALAPYKVEPPKATVNAADLAGAVITPVVTESAAPLPKAAPAKKPRVPKVGEKAAKTAKAADKAVKKAPAKKKAPVKKKSA